MCNVLLLYVHVPISVHGDYILFTNNLCIEYVYECAYVAMGAICPLFSDLLSVGDALSVGDITTQWPIFIQDDPFLSRAAHSNTG